MGEVWKENPEKGICLVRCSLARMFHQSGDQGDLGSRNRIWEVWVRIGHVWSDSAVSMNASCCVFGFRRA